MKRSVLLFISTILFVLGGCGGNEFDLDEEKVNSAVADRALKQKVIKEGNYKKEDIKVMEVCEAVEEGSPNNEFQGEYIVYWETNDSKYQRTFLMKDYKVDNGDVNFEPTDKCISFE
ncbi:hypothetical protein ACTWQL_09320 [Pseudalkalibacillus sp. R45]|uniref:hypothetical protein n=1 Tax=Pseudalkalibacillus sp. R45 TaxID=3457433 RepID=UPI003FCD4147